MEPSANHFKRMSKSSKEKTTDHRERDLRKLKENNIGLHNTDITSQNLLQIIKRRL